jgi:hypothetical protein
MRRIKQFNYRRNFQLSAPLEVNGGWPQQRDLILQEAFSVNFDYLGHLLYVSHCIENRVFLCRAPFWTLISQF